MAVNKEQLKKHHFWILSGLIPLLVLIAVILITSGVGSAIDKKKDEIDKAKKDLTAKKDPKSNPLLEKMGLQQKVLDAKRGDLWKENWDRQIGVDPATGKQDPEKNLLRWPASPALAPFNYTENYLKDPNQLKFGDTIKLAGQERPNALQEYNEFKKREVYLAEFSNARPGEGYAGTGMADTVAPTRFASGWEKTLRYVDIPPAGDKTGWGQVAPRSEQLWLALEDIWVQRAMLAAVRQVNADVARFARIPRKDDNGKDLPDDPLKRRFRSRLWEVELEVIKRETDQRWVMTGKLRNLSDRMALLGGQASGAPSPLVLNVWPSAEAGHQPFPFQIGGSFVPGGGTMTVLTTDKHVLPQGDTPVELAKVEQVFDAATVPVRRIDRLVLGYPDSRYAAVPLQMPKFKAFEEEAAAAAAAADTTGSASPMTMAPPPGTDAFGGGGRGGAGRPGAAARQLEGGGQVGAVVDGNRKRYVEITEQVRRMPVAITLVTDQAYIQDVLIAYANSPFRFQTTQVHWRRFRGALGGDGAGGSGVAGRGGLTGGFGLGLAGGGDDDAIGGAAAGVEGGGFTIGGGGLKGAALGFGPGGPGGPDGAPGGGRGGSAGGGAAVGAEQLNAGLIELTLYGVVSIYEKYQPTADGAVAAK